MNTALTKIANLTDKSRLILGLMSGTSLDGLDIALCKVSGHGLNTALNVQRFVSIGYSDESLALIRSLFAKPMAPLAEVTLVNAWLAREHACIVNNTLAKWGINPDEVDILASHGQTIFHAPNSLTLSKSRTLENEQHLASATLQIGDGDHLAYLTKILTVSDFRQKHIAANGEGAPLVPYADYLLFSDKQENRILANIGGIANFTYIPVNSGFGGVISADSGPGNTLMDAVVQFAKEHTANNSLLEPMPAIEKLYDANGEFASRGDIDEQLLSIMLGETNEKPVHQEKNKSTGQETYNINFVCCALAKRMDEANQAQESSSLINYLSKGEQAFYDLLATLNLFTAKTISKAIQNLPIPVNKPSSTTLYVSGGGVHNPVLMTNIQNCVRPLRVKLCDELGISADAKEAALFAVLANQTLFGCSSVFANDNKIPATAFGKISLP